VPRNSTAGGQMLILEVVTESEVKIEVKCEITV